MDSEEVAEVVETLDWVACHMGAGDERFDGFDECIPIKACNFDAAGGWMAGYEVNPTRSGLRHPWNIRFCSLASDYRMTCIEVESRHWSFLSCHWHSWKDRFVKAACTASDFEDVVVVSYGTFLPSGKRVKYRSQVLGFTDNPNALPIPLGRVTDESRRYVGGQMSSDASTCVGFAQIGVGLAAFLPMFWTVDIKVEPCVPSIRVLTDAVGVRALLRERDKPTEGRRAALLHWVSEHWRSCRVDIEAEGFVRKHFRGAKEVNWCGYSCVVTPSAIEIGEAEQAKVARSVMRTIGTDRRKKANSDEMIAAMKKRAAKVAKRKRVSA